MKYSLIKTDTKQFLGRTLFRIKAEVSFGVVVKGELGGYIEKEENLAQVSGNAWVSGDAWVYGNAWVEKTKDYSTISSLGDSARTITVTRSNGMVSAGCFLGTMKEFEAKVKEKYGKKGDYWIAIKFIKEWLKMK